MKILEITSQNRNRYENFLAGQNGDLHQSYPWGEFQRSLAGRGKFWALAVVDGEKWLATALVTRYQLPFGLCWLSLVRGPVVAQGMNEDHIWMPLLGAIEALSKREKAVFLRVELPAGSSLKLNGGGWRKAHAHYQPEWTLKIDLKPTEIEILAQMTQKGRYNIKVAQKRGVTVRKTHAPEDVHGFYGALTKTGERDAFSIHPESYYQAFVKAAQEGEWGDLFVAELDGKIIGGLIATYYGDTATYYYGASDHEYRASMAPYLVQWTAIQSAKKRGLRWYDFLGIAPPDDPNHPWAGVTQFKTRFGGETVQYPEAREFMFKPFWYALMRLRKRSKRGGR